MSESLVEEVDREIAKEQLKLKSPAVLAALATVRLITLVVVFICVTGGLWLNGIVHAELFGAATVASLIWLRRKQST